MRNLKLVSIAGIPIYLNFTLVLFLPVLAWLISRPAQIAAYAGAIEFFAGRPVDAAALSAGSTPLVLGALGAIGLMVGVLVHELAHSWAARRYDIEIVSITLWIFGGMARMDELPEDWSIEFWVALAGPVTSVLLSTLFFGALQVTPASAPVATFVVVIGFALEFGFARRLVFAFPSVVYDVVGSPQKLRDGFVEEVSIAVGHVKFDGDRATYLHPCFRCLLSSLY